MNLDYENAKVGAKIKIEGQELFIYKVNKKSFYAGKLGLKEIIQPKGVTWISFMKDIKGKKYSYGTAEISELEISKINDFIEKEKKQKKYLNSRNERELLEVYKQRVIGKSTKTPLITLETTKKNPPIVLGYNKDGWFLISLRDRKHYFFYNVLSKEYIDYNKEIHKNNVFPKKQEKIKKVS